MADAVAAEVTIWTDGPRAAAVGDVIELMGGQVKPIGVGGPRVAEVDELARRCDCRRDDDFRKMLIDRPASYVVLATMDEATCDDLTYAAEQSSTILAIEPPATTGDDLDTLVSAMDAGAQRIVPMPAFVATPGWTRAADPRETLGSPRSLVFDTCGRLSETSLFARLLDAWQTLMHFTGMPQSIDAALAGPITDVPRDLRGMTGSITAHARLTDGASAVIRATDRAGVSRRLLHVISDAADLQVRDADYELHDATGTLIDEHRPKLARTGLADLIAAQWQRLIERRGDASTWPHGLDADALACCQACLLSAKTGTPEDPGKLLRMRR